MQSLCSQSAARPQSGCSSSAVRPQPIGRLYAIRHRFLTKFESSSLAAYVMLVCAACQVSVAVRPACLGSRDLQGTRDTTPVSCKGFVSCQRCTALLVWRRWSCLWALRTHRRPLTQGPLGRRRDAGYQSVTGIIRRAALRHLRYGWDDRFPGHRKAQITDAGQRELLASVFYARSISSERA